MLSLLLSNVSVFASTAGAAASVNANTPLPKATPESGTPLFNNGAYRESALTYTGKSNYYLATRNSSYPNGSTVYVTFNGASGSVATTGTANGSTVFESTVVYLDGGKYAGATLAKANSTVFVDAGTYTDTSVANYTDLSASNLALIGLNPGAVVMKRQPYLRRSGATGTPVPYLERMIIHNSGMRYQNLIFDADGAGALSNGATSATSATQWSRDGGATWMTSGQVFGGSRGGGLFTIPSGANSVLIRNCTVRNMGGADLSVANYAVNLVNGSTGQVNLEGLAVENCRGSLMDGYRLINIGPAANVNIRNLTFNQGGGSLRDPIWLESPNGSTAGVEQASDVRFDGALNFNGYTGRQRIGMQLTSFKNLTLPAGYRYAVFATGEIPITASGMTTTQVLVYKSLSDFTQTWAASERSQLAVLDTKDNAWLVRQPQAGSVTATVDQQLTSINTILTRLGQPLSTTAAQNCRGLVTNAFIKIVADNDGTLPGFTVPSNTLGTEAGPRVFIKAVDSPDALFSDPINTSGGSGDTPLVAGAQITLSTPNNADVRLYNIDYSAQAHYTLEAAINGISSTEPTPTPVRIPGSTVDTFASSRFTALAQALTLSVPLDNGDVEGDDNGMIYQVPTDLAPFTATAKVSQAFTLSEAGFEQVTPSEEFAVDDPTVAWESDDTGVATVDPESGLVTVLNDGVVNITARSTDRYNNGEIMRPNATFTLMVQPQMGTVVTNYVSIDGSQLAESSVLTGKVGLPFVLDPLVFDGYYLQNIEGPTSGAFVNGSLETTFTYAPIPTAGDIFFNSNGGSEVISVWVNPDGTLVRPPDPTRPGFTFGGWFKDEALTIPWDFANDKVFEPVSPAPPVTPVRARAQAKAQAQPEALAGNAEATSETATVTLYAKWIEDVTDPGTGGPGTGGPSTGGPGANNPNRPGGNGSPVKPTVPGTGVFDTATPKAPTAKLPATSDSVSSTLIPVLLVLPAVAGFLIAMNPRKQRNER